MARIRSIKPDFFKNEELAELPVLTRLLFIGLWTQADREGRIEDRPKRIKAELFPYDKLDVDKCLNELNSEGFILRYIVDSVAVIQIKEFLRHQIPGRDEPQSELPANDGSVKEYIKPPNETVRNRIYLRDGFKCAYCNEDLINKSRSRCLDHIIPYAKGGSNHESNLITSCKRCNVLKGCRTPAEAGLLIPVNHPLTVLQNGINGFVTGREMEGKGNGKEEEMEGVRGESSVPLSPPPDDSFSDLEDEDEKEKNSAKKEKGFKVASESYKAKGCQFGTSFKKAWIELCGMPKWIKKPQTAIELALFQLMKYDEEFSIKLIQNTIAGNYQGVVYDNTDEKYQDHLNKKNGKPKFNDRESRQQSVDDLRQVAQAILRGN